jgi:hypothetical protein
VVPQHVRIATKYEGVDVREGTMPASDVIVALQGFAVFVACKTKTTKLFRPRS